MKNYESSKDRDADVAALAGDHRFDALLDLIAEFQQGQAYSAGNDSVISDHGQLAYHVGKMDAYRELGEHLADYRKHNDT